MKPPPFDLCLKPSKLAAGSDQNDVDVEVLIQENCSRRHNRLEPLRGSQIAGKNYVKLGRQANGALTHASPAEDCASARSPGLG